MIVTVVALLMILSPLMVLAFVVGRRSIATGANRCFDQLRSDAVSAAGTWQVEFDGDDPTTTQTVLLELQQVGSARPGAGRSMDGTGHSLEGIVHRAAVCAASRWTTTVQGNGRERSQRSWQAGDQPHDGDADPVVPSIAVADDSEGDVHSRRPDRVRSLIPLESDWEERGDLRSGVSARSGDGRETCVE